MMSDELDFEYLLEDIHSNDKQKQRDALYKLAQMHSSDARRMMLSLLDHKNREVRVILIQALTHLKVTMAIEKITEMLQDRSKEVRKAAARSLGVFLAENAVSALADALLSDESSLVRNEAAKALSIIASPEALPELLEALAADQSSYVRYSAAEALGMIGDKNALDALEHALLNDENSYVRFAAAHALSQFNDETSIPTLIQAMNDRNLQVLQVVSESLWDMEESAVPHIRAALLAPDMTTRRAGFKALMWLTTDSAENTVVMDDDDILSGIWGWWN